MKFAKRIILLLIVSFFTVQLSAQNNKKTADADLEFENKGYVSAAEKYTKVLPKLKDIDEKSRVLFKIGECYREVTRYDEAEEWYRKAITANYDDVNPEVHFNYGEIYRLQGKYDEAVVKYQKYIEKGGDKKKGEGAISSCEQSVVWIEVPPTRYEVQQEVTLNTKFFDYSPTFSTKKMDEMIISTSRPATEGKGTEEVTGEAYMDLFSSKMDKKGKWSTPEPLNNTINTEYSEGTCAFDKKFKTMYFTRCINKGDDRTGCDIYFAKKSGNNYGVAERIDIIDREKNDSTNVGHPVVIGDDILIFSSNMNGGQGGKDLYSITYDDKSKKWSKPKNLGKNINTSDDEIFPYVHKDGSLYFASNGMMGMGGFDIYKAESTGELSWDNPINLQYPINSSSDDFGITYEKDVDAGFFTSNRSGGKGKDDIYHFAMPPLVFNYTGIVYDDETGAALANTQVVITESPGGNSWDLMTDGNGGVSLSNGEIKEASTYSLSLSNDKGTPVYIGQTDQFSTIGLTESTTVSKEYFLIPITVDPIEMPKVFYVFDSPSLIVNEEINSKDSLDYLFKVLSDNPTFIIELDAHSDTRGDAGYNLTLSQKRAKTCVDYLVSKGIDPLRMTGVGKGETDPIIPDSVINKESDQAKIDALHEVNRRTNFRVVGYDFGIKEE